MSNTTRNVYVATAALILGFLATQSMASSDRSFRCGTYLIIGGGGKDSAGMYEVLKKCGEPNAKQGYTWIYVQGSMHRILTFNNEGRLARIESKRG